MSSLDRVYEIACGLFAARVACDLAAVSSDVGAGSGHPAEDRTGHGCVVDLRLAPLESAVMLCVDEKSQVQALACTSPVEPMMPWYAERRTHDHVRHGVTNLFAAFNIADGTVTFSIHRRHRGIEFKKFLAKIDDEVPGDLDVTPGL